MAVIDEELLALAGDSSDEDDMPQSTARNANSPLPSIEIYHANSSKGRKQSTSTSKVRGGSSRIKTSYPPDSEDEGEAYVARDKCLII